MISFPSFVSLVIILSFLNLTSKLQIKRKETHQAFYQERFPEFSKIVVIAFVTISKDTGGQAIKTAGN